ncbi:cysteine-rich receptor-like protein kinase 29 [Tanacetum coccineum]
MACSIPHSDDEIQALVQKQIDEDMVHQKAILDLALKFDNACTTKEDLRKRYEKLYSDLLEQQCTNCLKDAVGEMVSRVSRKIGVQMYLPKCIMRYENYRFYSDLPIIPQPDSPPPEAQEFPSGTFQI